MFRASDSPLKNKIDSFPPFLSSNFDISGMDYFKFFHSILAIFGSIHSKKIVLRRYSTLLLVLMRVGHDLDTLFQIFDSYSYTLVPKRDFG